MADNFNYKDWGIAGLYSAGTMLNVYGSFYQGEDAKNKADFNASQLRKTRDDVLRNSELTGSEFDRYSKDMLASQEAAFTRGNVAIGGSTVDIMADTATQLERQKAEAIYKQKVQAEQLDFQAQFAKAQGKSAKTQAQLQGVGESLGGIMKIFDRLS